NILDRAFTTVGVGVVDSADGTVWVTEDFMGTGNVLPVPVVTQPTPRVTVPPKTTVDPKVTTPAPRAVVPAPSPSHAEPATPAKPRPSVPVPSPSRAAAVEKAASRPTPASVPVATPILDPIPPVAAGPGPDAA